MKNKIIVIGSSNTDMVMRVHDFPQPGETVIGLDFMQNQGGKGANQAVACARLQGEVAFIAKVGKDALGGHAIKVLSEEHMDLTQMTQTEEQPTGTAFITVNDEGENSIIVNSGANACLSRTDIDAATPMLAEAGYVLMQLETPIETLTYAAQKAHQYGAMVILNPAPASPTPLPQELLQHIDLLIPNETELRLLCGKRDDALCSTEECMRQLQREGIREIVTTTGAKGAVALIEGVMTAFPSRQVKAVDTTAAGDTFCGALCVALSKGETMADAIRFACDAAAVTVSRPGAQQSIPYLEEV